MKNDMTFTNISNSDLLGLNLLYLLLIFFFKPNIFILYNLQKKTSYETEVLNFDFCHMDIT